jgi:hypothetical protein
MRMYIYMGDKTGPVTVEHQLQAFLLPEQFILSLMCGQSPRVHSVGPTQGFGYRSGNLVTDR